MKQVLAKLAGGAGGDIVEAIGDTVDRFVTTREERMAWEQVRARMIADGDRLQLEVAQLEAQGNWYQRGWRPTVGWACAASFLVMFTLVPLLMLIRWLVDPGFDVDEFRTVVDSIFSPALIGAFMPVLLGMLGLGSLRTFEKTRAGVLGANRRTIRAVTRARRRLAKAGIDDEEAEQLIRDAGGLG